MISRVAECCFWMLRYVERVENTARLLQVNLSLVLDVSLPLLEQWQPLIIVTGEEERFTKLIGKQALGDGEAVQDYLVWDERNPMSMVTCLRWARENARTIRETISVEMWESFNEFWLWLTGRTARRLWNRDRHAFYDHIRDSCQLFHGICHNTMLHEEPFDFMRLGMLLERSAQIARILDVKHHTLGPTTGDRETPVEAAQWLAILRSCSAGESFRRRTGSSLTGPAVAGFLLLEPAFPRSILHCLDRASNFMSRIRPPDLPELGERSEMLVRKALSLVQSRTMDDILKAGIHEELTRIIDTTTEVCGAVHDDYFDPSIPAPMAGPRTRHTGRDRK